MAPCEVGTVGQRKSETCEGQAELHQAGREPQGFQAKGGHREEGKSVSTEAYGAKK